MEPKAIVTPRTVEPRGQRPSGREQRKAALRRLNSSAAAERKEPSRELGGSERRSAARSHLENQQYMQEFHRALEALGLSDDRLPEARPLRAPLGLECSTPARSDVWRQAVSDRWGTGPTDPAGVLYDLSDRPLLACSLFANELLVGASDHAAYAIDTTRRRTRKLYSATSGHTEWVTSVAHTSDGRAVTAGMDGRVCVWERGTDRCSCLTWNGVRLASVSKVVADEARPLVFASDYDGCVTAWDFSQRGRSSLEGALQLARHEAPVLDFTYAGQVLASVARDGTLFAWDLSTGELRKRYRAHNGHATCVAAMPGQGCFASGGQDGFLKLWDLREPRSTRKIGAHTSRVQTGAVGQIIVCSEAGGEQIISAGADKAICVHDSRMDHRELYRWEHHRSFIYSMAVTGQRFVSTGAGDGMLLVHDLSTGSLCYGIGACKNGAVRAIASSADRLCIVNEDGDAIEFSF